MGNTKMISKLLEFFHFRTDLLYGQYRNEFLSEIRLLNLAVSKP
jgi:hypothetical protein